MALFCVGGQRATAATEVGEGTADSVRASMCISPDEWLSPEMKSNLRGADGTVRGQNYSHADCWLEYRSGYAGPFTGSNPSTAELFAAIRTLAVQYQVPVEIIGACCFQESGANQYGADGFVVHNLTACKSFFAGAAGGPPALGLMQLTGPTAREYDVNRLMTDWRYNLEAGVDVLRQKFDRALRDDPVAVQTVATANWSVLENWRYALAFYNGCQNPENPCVAKVCSFIAFPPARLAGLFSGVTLTRPEEVITTFVYGNGYAVTPDGAWLYCDGSTFSGTAHVGDGTVAAIAPSGSLALNILSLPGGYFWNWKGTDSGSCSVESQLKAGYGYWSHIVQAMTWGTAPGAAVP